MLKYIISLLVLITPVDLLALPSASRTTGVAPLSVVFTADLTASSPTERNFHDLEYSWNFGDGSSGNWGTDGKSKNTDKGPIAAHVYETSGTYNATLNVRGVNGPVGTPYEIEINVDDPDVVFAGSNTFCISDLSSNDFTGCPVDVPAGNRIATDSLANMSTWLTSGKRVLLRRGSSWDAAQQLAESYAITQARLGAYGVCVDPDANGICTNAPLITPTFDSAALFSLHNKNDFVIQDLSFLAPKYTDISSSVTTGGLNLTGFLFLRNKVRGFYTGVSWYHSRDETYPGSPTNMSVVACDIRDFYGYAQYGGGENLSIAGNQFHNSDTTHISRLWWTYKGVYSHNMASGASLTNTAGRVNLKLHGPKYTDDQDGNPDKLAEVGTFAETGSGGLPCSTQYVVVADNVLAVQAQDLSIFCLRTLCPMNGCMT